jgi:hypothetical protein
MPDLDRFMLKLRLEDECWVWTARLDRDGYGAQFKIGSRSDGTRRSIRPHRFIYEALLERIPYGLVIDHLCRNRACQNPFHMEPVTTEVNTKRGARANARFCKSGHPLSGGNLYTSSTTGKRACVTCRNRWAREHGKRTNWAAVTAYRARQKENYHRTR